MDQIFGEPGVIQPTQKHRHSLQKAYCQSSLYTQVLVAEIPSISISGIWDLISGLDATTERFCPDQTGSFSVRKGNLVDLLMMDQIFSRRRVL